MHNYDKFSLFQSLSIIFVISYTSLFYKNAALIAKKNERRNFANAIEIDLTFEMLLTSFLKDKKD